MPIAQNKTNIEEAKKKKQICCYVLQQGGLSERNLIEDIDR